MSFTLGTEFQAQQQNNGLKKKSYIISQQNPERDTHEQSLLRGTSVGHGGHAVS
jgi:hypothetical protein